jgi:hypothetical protein
VDLRGSILKLEKQAKAAAAVPYTVDQGLPSARRAQPANKFQNQRKTRCNRLFEFFQAVLGSIIKRQEGQRILAYHFSTPITLEISC